MSAVLQNNISNNIFTAQEILNLMGKKVKFLADEPFLHPDTNEPVEITIKDLPIPSWYQKPAVKHLRIVA